MAELMEAHDANGVGKKQLANNNNINDDDFNGNDWITERWMHNVTVSTG